MAAQNNDVQVPWTKQIQTGKTLIENSRYNKGLAFTEHERTTMCLHGLLPPRIMTLEEQAHQVMWNIRRKVSNLDKYQYLMSILDSNEKLFYNVLINNVFDLMPIVYTPTVGLACQRYGYIFTNPRGLYVTIKDLGRVRSVLRNWPQSRVEGIVFTDGQRILGLGDLGAFGMGIPVGKLALYTACAGVNPSRLLPITIDVGTNNQDLLDDEFYIGLKQKRPEGEQEKANYDALILEFMTEARELWGPSCLLQFEDFGNANAFRLLQMHRHNFCTFNDDIQGTASIALAGLYSAMRITGGKLSDQVYCFLGAGSAGIGIADLISLAISQEEGMSVEEARKRTWLVDSRGLIFKGRERLTAQKVKYAHPREGGSVKALEEIVKEVGATCLIGVSGQSGAFTEAVCRQMAANTDRPIIFPYSNPNSKAEQSAENCYKWTNNRCIFASGSPWPQQEIEFDGRKFEVIPAQGNNAYIFPGVALAIIATKCTRVPEQFFIEAAKCCSSLVSEQMLSSGTIYPPLKDIREVSLKIAVAVADFAYSYSSPNDPDFKTLTVRPKDLEGFLRSKQYDHSRHEHYAYNLFAENAME